MTHAGEESIEQATIQERPARRLGHGSDRVGALRVQREPLAPAVRRGRYAGHPRRVPHAHRWHLLAADHGCRLAWWAEAAAPHLGLDDRLWSLPGHGDLYLLRLDQPPSYSPSPGAPIHPPCADRAS